MNRVLNFQRDLQAACPKLCTNCRRRLRNGHWHYREGEYCSKQCTDVFNVPRPTVTKIK